MRNHGKSDGPLKSDTAHLLCSVDLPGILRLGMMVR